MLREAAQPLQIFEGARVERMQQQWSALACAVDGVPDSKAFKDAAACLWTEEQRVPTKEVLEMTMPRAALGKPPPARRTARAADGHIQHT
jgi:hypothetical protein